MNPLMPVAEPVGRRSLETGSPSPAATSAQLWGGRISHTHRVAQYAWAASFASGRTILDACAGAGFGASLLARSGAARVVGVDSSIEAVAHASSGRGEVEFVQGEVTALPFPGASFDMVVCFGALETHDARAVIHELRRVLRPNGVALLSAAAPSVSDRHLAADELERLMAGAFQSFRLERQQLWAASLIAGPETSGAADPCAAAPAGIHKVSGASPASESFTLAIASAGELPPAVPLVALVDAYDVSLWQDRIEEFREQARVARHELAVYRGREEVVDLNARRTAAALEELSAENARLFAERDRLRRELTETLAAVHGAEHWLTDLQASLSWRLTRPLRGAMAGLRRVRRRSRPATLQAPQ